MKKKSTTLAYVLWFLSGFGWLGFHRMYLGNFENRFWWWISIGYFFLGSLYDLIYIPEFTRNVNAQLSDLNRQKYLYENKDYISDRNENYASTEPYEVRRLDGSLIPLSQVECMIESKMFLIRNNGQTYHTHYDCYKYWSEPIQKSFRGWIICTPEETENAGCMSKCSFCAERDEKLEESYALQSQTVQLPDFMIETQLMLRGEIKSDMSPYPAVKDDSILVWQKLDVKVAELHSPSSVYIDYKKIQTGFSAKLRWNEQEINSEDPFLSGAILVVINGINTGYLYDNSEAKKNIIKYCCTGTSLYWYVASVSYINRIEKMICIKVAIYEHINYSDFIRLGSIRLVKTLNKDHQKQIEYVRSTSIITFSKIYNSDGDSVFVAFFNNKEIGEIPVKISNSLNLSKYSMLLGKVTEIGMTPSGKKYPIFELYAK